MNNKRRGTHTSVMDDGIEVVKILRKLSIVKGISPGIIVKKNSVSGSRSIKLVESTVENRQIITMTICSKLYKQQINILIYKTADNAAAQITHALKKYSEKHNINLK